MSKSVFTFGRKSTPSSPDTADKLSDSSLTSAFTFGDRSGSFTFGNPFGLQQPPLRDNLGDTPTYTAIANLTAYERRTLEVCVTSDAFMQRYASPWVSAHGSTKKGQLGWLTPNLWTSHPFHLLPGYPASRSDLDELNACEDELTSVESKAFWVGNSLAVKLAEAKSVLGPARFAEITASLRSDTKRLPPGVGF